MNIDWNAASLLLVNATSGLSLGLSVTARRLTFKLKSGAIGSTPPDYRGRPVPGGAPARGRVALQQVAAVQVPLVGVVVVIVGHDLHALALQQGGAQRGAARR